MHKLHTATGSPVIHSSKIAKACRDYYAHLYHHTLLGTMEAQKAERILQYFPQLSTLIGSQLDVPISQAEVAVVIKDLPKGKSP